MVHHIVMWNFKDEIPVEKRDEIKETMQKELSGLVGQVPGLLTVDFVKTPLASSTHDIALVTTLEKAEDIAVYAVHPAHVAVADNYVRPYVCNRSCLDYE